MNFIDTHAHLYGEEFVADLPQVVERARLSGASKVFLPATDLPSAREAVKLSGQYTNFFYPMLGLHPEDLPENFLAILEEMECQLQQPHPYIGIGEVGLDFYWDASRMEEQIKAFEIQIGWALRFGLPLMIHARSAHEQLVNCLNPYRKKAVAGVFHCFTGTSAEAADLLSFDHFMLGIGGVVTFKKSSLPEVLKTAVPLSRIVLETDAPYMSPVPHRGQRNETSFLPAVITKLSEIYEVTPENVMRMTTENALKVFPLAR